MLRELRQERPDRALGLRSLGFQVQDLVFGVQEFGFGLRGLGLGV